MNRAVISFVERNVSHAEIAEKTVLEVGSLDVNGSVRPHLESLAPANYLGVDISEGPSVDDVCDVGQLVSRYGQEAFDVVVTTELVEHVKDWRAAFDNMKQVLRPEGLMIVTTRSAGFKVHGYPYDYWRYEPEDMRAILADFEIKLVERDTFAPGVFVKAAKPRDWSPADLSRIALYSVVTRSRALDVTGAQEAAFKFVYHAHRGYRRLLPESVRSRVKRLVLR
jgi:SAM-dependent methyltransferase